MYTQQNIYRQIEARTRVINCQNAAINPKNYQQLRTLTQVYKLYHISTLLTYPLKQINWKKGKNFKIQPWPIDLVDNPSPPTQES